MKIKKITRSISFRVSDLEHELLKDAAEQRSLSEGMTARSIVLESLSGYDRKQEFLLRRIDRIDETLELLISISSLGAAACSLPLDAEQQDVAALRDKLKILLIMRGKFEQNALRNFRSKVAYWFYTD